MLKAGNKHPLQTSLGENSRPTRAKRGRFDNVILLREEENENESTEQTNSEAPRQILRAGRKRKKPSDNNESNFVRASISGASTSNITGAGIDQGKDENDIISELTKEFKKARLRPVFFTISSFIEQTVDEVGFTMVDEPDIEVTVKLNFKKSSYRINLEDSDGSPELKNALQISEDAPPDLVHDCSEGKPQATQIQIIKN